MAKLILAILTTVAVVAFAISNSHHVDLSFGIGMPIRIRLVFLLTCTFVTGAMVPIFYQMFRRVKHKRAYQKAQNDRQATTLQQTDFIGG